MGGADRFQFSSGWAEIGRRAGWKALYSPLFLQNQVPIDFYRGGIRVETLPASRVISSEPFSGKGFRGENAHRKLLFSG